MPAMAKPDAVPADAAEAAPDTAALPFAASPPTEAPDAAVADTEAESLRFNADAPETEADPVMEVFVIAAAVAADEAAPDPERVKLDPEDALPRPVTPPAAAPVIEAEAAATEPLDCAAVPCMATVGFKLAFGAKEAEPDADADIDPLAAACAPLVRLGVPASVIGPRKMME